MHLLTSYKTGALKGLPQTLPQGLYDVAARRGSVRSSTGSRASDVPPVPAIPKQFSGSGPQRTQSPITRPPQYGSPLSAQSTGGDWLISPQEKAHFDTIFATIDKAGFGQINGEQAVTFFTNAQLPEETLAQIWDLADIDSDGQLSKEEFAVAMYLVRQQRTKKEPVPQVLPPALVPPSMRRQAAAQRPAQPPPAAAPPPPTASDDLFGLDAFNTPSQVPQSTGGSNGPFQPASPTSRASPPGASSTFKPFIPSSSFGQSLTPQGTGAAASSQNKAAPQPSDDLLGDNDPEESKKLTQETTELGNLSNQISSLSNEMQNVQGKRASTEQEVAQNNQQKRDFEARLAQARTMYDQEVKNFKALEERLASSRAETKKLQQDFALIDGSRQDLQTQYSQAAAALESDQRENASLKEKIRQANTEVTQLKPQLEKVRSDARQQKGLVAINKKQLATVEGERDRLRDDIDEASKDTENVDQDVAPPAAVSSPAASVASQNTNPFFRRTATGSTDNALASPGTTREKPSDAQSAFDSFFGPSMTTPSASAPPPPTSFRSESYDSASRGLKGSESSGNPTPSTSPPPVAKEPPPPPQSRQITPSILPLRENSQQSISTTSSIKVSPPASRFGAVSGGSEVETSVPSTSAASPGSTEQDKGESTSNKPREEVPAKAVDTDSLRSESDSSSQPNTLPGAFPEPPTSTDTGKDGQADASFDELFGGVARERSSSQKAMDFEEAMASMGRKTDAPKTNGDSAQAKSTEFPPIREIDDDDDEDSTDSEMGFDDDFTATSPPRNTGSSPHQKEASSDDQQMRAFPPIETVTGSNTPLPGADSQSSPPTYDKSAAKDVPTDFPSEFNGLLPNRSDPTSAPDAPHSKETATGDPVIGGVPQHDTTASTGDKKAGPADFEAAFAGLDLAPAEADEDDDDDPFESHTNKYSTDFDMTFDSPGEHAKSTNANSGTPAPGNGTGAEFFNFDSNIAQPAGTAPGANPDAANSHDWDALFSNLDAPKKTDSGESDEKGSAGTPGTAKPPGWALGVDTGEDDTILQRLTSMGYPRDESLAALEKFDYNIDKVRSLDP